MAKNIPAKGLRGKIFVFSKFGSVEPCKSFIISGPEFGRSPKSCDSAYGQGNIACCGGDENGNGNSTSVPTGIYVEVGGGNGGEWGVFNITRDPIIDDDTGELKGYKLSADTYCGPSAMHGGCNVHLYGWVKLKHRGN